MNILEEKVMHSKGAKLKALIYSPEILVTPGICDGFSARVVESAT